MARPRNSVSNIELSTVGSQVQVYGARTAYSNQSVGERLSSLGLTMTDLTNVVGQSNSLPGGGQSDRQKNRTYLLVSERPVVDSPAIRKETLIAARPNGQSVYIKDVATNRKTVEDEWISRIFGRATMVRAPAEVVLAVSRLGGENAVEGAQR